MQRLRCFCALVRLCKLTARILGRVGFACTIQPQARDTRGAAGMDRWAVTSPLRSPHTVGPPTPSLPLCPPLCLRLCLGAGSVHCLRCFVERQGPVRCPPSCLLTTYLSFLVALPTWPLGFMRPRVCCIRCAAGCAADRLICTGQLSTCSLPTCTCVSCVFVVFDAVPCHWRRCVCALCSLFVACVRVSCVRPSYKYCTSTRETSDNKQETRDKRHTKIQCALLGHT
eukprot:scaffold7500_cov127-Isochrysis_galbana.AAC.19